MSLDGAVSVTLAVRAMRVFRTQLLIAGACVGFLGLIAWGVVPLIKTNQELRQQVARENQLNLEAPRVAQSRTTDLENRIDELQHQVGQINENVSDLREMTQAEQLNRRAEMVVAAKMAHDFCEEGKPATAKDILTYIGERYPDARQLIEVSSLPTQCKP